MMKKKILITLLALLFPCSLAYAMTDDDDWTYFFYLQYKEGVLAQEEGAAYPYDPIPVYFDGPTDKATAQQSDFYGTIVSGKGVSLAYFGFNKPETIIPALGKSVFTVKAPFYANASRVDFYQKSGKKLFTISVSGSSFCNDNNKCNASVGENYRNCPNDCPPPPGGIPPREFVPPPEMVTPPSPAVMPTTEPAPEDVGGAVLPSTAEVTTSETPTPQKGVDTKMMVAVVTGILALLLAGLMFYMRKTMSMDEGA
jgi:hypothetical protein